MARTVKPDVFASKRNEILNATQRLIMVKGYDQMAIQDILDVLRISSGSFHHYFESRKALLDALIERMRIDAEKPLIPIIYSPHLTAIQKLQGVFDALDQIRIGQKASIVDLLRVWYADENAVVRQKVDEAIFRHRAPLLTEIVRQGVQESIFTTIYPDRAGEVVLSLMQGMGNTHARILLSLDQESDEQCCIEGIVAAHAAYMDAIERVLGAPMNSLHRTDAEAVKVWVSALNESRSTGP